MTKILKKGENIAVRSDSIIEARFSLTAKQNELLDMLLCEIKDDNEYQYTISVDKYKILYDTDTSNLYRDLKKAVKGFEGKGFRILSKTNGEEIYYAWFSKIHYIPKKGEIHVNVDLDFKKLLWEVKKKIYYDIKNTLNFNSVYSQRMYYYLKSFEDTGWRIDLMETLLQKLECPQSYKNFSDFKRAVLDVAEKEINNGEDIGFTYETRKKGNKIDSIKFNIVSKYKERMSCNSNYVERSVENSINETNNINNEYINRFKSIVKENLSTKGIIQILENANYNFTLIESQYKIMKRQNHVDDIVSWLKKAVLRKYDSPVKYSSNNISKFNDYPQREYDYDKLERKLLGEDLEQLSFDEVATGRG